MGGLVARAAAIGSHTQFQNIYLCEEILFIFTPYKHCSRSRQTVHLKLFFARRPGFVLRRVGLGVASAYISSRVRLKDPQVEPSTPLEHESRSPQPDFMLVPY